MILVSYRGSISGLSEDLAKAFDSGLVNSIKSKLFTKEITDENGDTFKVYIKDSSKVDYSLSLGSGGMSLQANTTILNFGVFEEMRSIKDLKNDVISGKLSSTSKTGMYLRYLQKQRYAHRMKVSMGMDKITKSMTIRILNPTKSMVEAYFALVKGTRYMSPTYSQETTDAGTAFTLKTNLNAQVEHLSIDLTSTGANLVSKVMIQDVTAVAKGNSGKDRDLVNQFNKMLASSPDSAGMYVTFWGTRGFRTSEFTDHKMALPFDNSLRQRLTDHFNSSFTESSTGATVDTRIADINKIKYALAGSANEINLNISTELSNIRVSSESNSSFVNSIRLLNLVGASDNVLVTIGRDDNGNSNYSFVLPTTHIYSLAFAQKEIKNLSGGGTKTITDQKTGSSAEVGYHSMANVGYNVNIGAGGPSLAILSSLRNMRIKTPVAQSDLAQKLINLQTAAGSRDISTALTLNMNGTYSIRIDAGTNKDLAAIIDKDLTDKITGGSEFDITNPQTGDSATLRIQPEAKVEYSIYLGAKGISVIPVTNMRFITIVSAEGPEIGRSDLTKAFQHLNMDPNSGSLQVLLGIGADKRITVTIEGLTESQAEKFNPDLISTIRDQGILEVGINGNMTSTRVIDPSIVKYSLSAGANSLSVKATTLFSNLEIVQKTDTSKMTKFASALNEINVSSGNLITASITKDKNSPAKVFLEGLNGLELFKLDRKYPVGTSSAIKRIAGQAYRATLGSVKNLLGSVSSGSGTYWAADYSSYKIGGSKSYIRATIADFKSNAHHAYAAETDIFARTTIYLTYGADH